MPFSPEIENDPLHLTAADWFVRLQSTEVTLEETLAWQAWLHENPANAETFARIEEISHALCDVPAPAAVPAALLAHDRYDASVPIAYWKPRRAQPWAWAALGAAASFALIALVFAFWRTPVETQAFETEVGENRSVTLADGSIISLGGDTRIEVALSKNVRAIDLARGKPSSRSPRIRRARSRCKPATQPSSR